MDVYLSFTTIPSRIARTIYIIKTLLQHEQDQTLTFTKLFLNVPFIYRLPSHGIIPLKHIWELQRIEKESKGKFCLIRPWVDYGPLTKLLPVIENHAKHRIDLDRSILVIFDDECYHVELIQHAIEKQMNDLKRSFTYYRYDYKGIDVPQGVDLITFYMKHLREFPQYERRLSITQSACFYVDDLVIGNYLKSKGVPIEVLSRGTYQLPWIPDCITKDTVSLYAMQGASSRTNSMNGCYVDLTRKNILYSDYSDA
jgi:hypothetical protein